MADYRIRIVVDGEDKGAGRMLDGLGGSLGRIGEFAAGSLLADGIKAVGSGIAGLGGAMMGAAMEAADLNAQISGIVALSGGGQSDIQALKETISSIAVNPDLVVGADEAAGVIQELIANGLQLSDIYAGAAESTVLLANATGAEFTTAATVASDTMSIFGIKAEDMMTAVNGITGVVNASKFDINDYALALSQGGGVAAAVGVEFEDFNAAITAMSSRFSSGSDAGTSFKTMLQRLIPQSDDAYDAMVELGLITTDYEKAATALGKTLGAEVQPTSDAVYGSFVKLQKSMGVTDPKKLAKAWSGFIQNFDNSAFFDANGQMEEMGSIVGALNEAFAGLTEEQKLNFATTIAGSDAMRAMLGLADMTETEFRQLMATMGETDALESAGIRTDNLKGDMDRFAGTLEDVRKRVGDSWDPALRSMYQSGNRLLTNLSPGLIAAAEGVAGYIEQVTPQVTSAIESFVSKFEEAYTKVGGGVAGVVAGLGAGTGAAVTVDASVTTVDWGDFSYTYDATSGITTVDWGAFGYQYDSTTGITSIDWTGNILGSEVGFVYDSQAGITKVEWHEDSFSYTYDASVGVTTVDFAGGLFSGNYTAAASVTSVLWGVYYHIYDSSSTVTDVAWGAYKHQYTATAQVSETSVLWGAYSHEYNAKAKIDGQSVLWGAWSHQYQSTTQISETDILWGGWTNTYDAFAQVGEKSVLWGLWTNTYDAKSNLTSLTIAGKSPSEWASSLSGSWIWPALPLFAWPLLPAWSWPAYVAFTWPAYDDWSWPAYDDWSWPAYDDWSWPRLPTWDWPDIPTPTWLDALLSALNNLNPFANATGTSFFPGGLSWVGEKGPELLSLPRGAQILNHERSMAYAGAMSDDGGSGGGAVTIINHINNRLDIHTLTRQVADELRRNR